MCETEELFSQEQVDCENDPPSANLRTLIFRKSDHDEWRWWIDRGN